MSLSMEALKREQALNTLLQPITWDWSSSVRSRQNLVIRRRNEVKTAMPFMTPEELERANKWLKDEAHSDLWD